MNFKLLNLVQTLENLQEQVFINIELRLESSCEITLNSSHARDELGYLQLLTCHVDLYYMYQSLHLSLS